MTTGKILLYIFSIISLATIVLPFIRMDHWFFRIFDYPRVQKFVLSAIGAALWLLSYRNSLTLADKIILGLLFISMIYLLWIILPFTPWGTKMVDNDKTGNRPLKFLVANVYQDNREYNRLLELVKKNDPDVLFLAETDEKWAAAMQELTAAYPHQIWVPMDNTYGMLFFSKLPILHKEVNFLVEDTIPSIIADVNYDGRTVRIFGLHPTPPVPQENEHSTERDAEILIVGKMAKKYQGPCVVLGDLNDVAWSYTTTLFLKTSGLMDPRRGRGPYNTFHADYWLLRWPLDHYFVSGHFRVAAMKVEDAIGSDHFPISIALTLCEEDESSKLEETNGDRQLREEKIDAGIKHEPR